MRRTPGTNQVLCTNQALLLNILIGIINRITRNKGNDKENQYSLHGVSIQMNVNEDSRAKTERSLSLMIPSSVRSFS
jgi:hypothetical protein